MLYGVCLMFLMVWSAHAAKCKITSTGSSTVRPFANAAAAEVKKTVGVDVSVGASGSSTTGIQAALSGSVDIGHASRALKGSESGLKCVEVAKDDIVVISNKALGLPGTLSLAKVTEIFSDSEGTYTYSIPDKGSGTRDTFEAKAGAAVKANLASVSGSVDDGALVSKVATTENAVGFVSAGANFPSSVQVSKVSGGVFERPLFYCYNPDNPEVMKVKKYISLVLDVAGSTAGKVGLSPPSGVSGSKSALGCASNDLDLENDC